MTDTGGLTPHGFCLVWDPTLLTWTVLGDAMTAAAYAWIPLQLTVALWRTRGGGRLVLTDNRTLIVLFASFILLCGLSHIMHIVTLFEPAYWTEAVTTIATGVVSLLTAGTMQWVFRPGRSQHEWANLMQQYEFLAVKYRRLADGTDTPAEAEALLARLGDMRR